MEEEIITEKEMRKALKKMKRKKLWDMMTSQWRGVEIRRQELMELLKEYIYSIKFERMANYLRTGE